jgi:serine/threonine-protein kinase
MPWGPLAEGVLLGKYRLLRRMGEGGMAVVFEAEHTRLLHRVAIKVLRDEHAQNRVLVERFEREGRAVGKLKSRHTVRVLDVDSTPSGAPYLVMEFLDGIDLAAELARRGPLPIGDAVGYVRQACWALSEAHALGIIHRDIKPSNLFLTNEGSARILKVLDFGIARELPGVDVRLTQTETVMGTPLYMAPEQFRGARDVDARADVWALGATLFELLAGRPPFVGTAATIGVSILTEPTPSVGQARTDVPPALAAIVSRALEKDRASRFASAAELGEALAAFASDVVISRRSPASSPPEGTVIGTAQTQRTAEARTGRTGPAVVSGVGALLPRTRYRRLGLTAGAIAGVLAVAAFVRFTASKTPSSREPAMQAPTVSDSTAIPAAQRAEVEPPAPEPHPPVSSLPPASSLAPAVSSRPATSAAPSSRTPRAAPSRSASSATPSSTSSSPPLFYPGQ